jgi:hypothetical protein
MSNYSKELAGKFHGAKQKQVMAELKSPKPERILDEGFFRLKCELLQHLKMQCEELNQEPQIGNILVCDLTHNAPQITRTDTGAVLSVKIDAAGRTVAFQCDKPVKFEYVLRVKPTISGGGSWYEGNGASIGNSLDAVAQKAVSALLGIETDPRPNPWMPLKPRLSSLLGRGPIDN